MTCPICNSNFLFTEDHHIESVCYGGSNKPFNKCKICPNCHTLVHAGEIIIEGKFSSTGGTILIWRNKGEESITGLPDPKVYLYKRETKDYDKQIPNDDSGERWSFTETFSEFCI